MTVDFQSTTREPLGFKPRVVQLREPVRSTWRTLYLACAAVGASALVAWRIAVADRERRRLLQLGKIRPLHSQWLTVNGCRTYARVSMDGGSSSGAPVVLVHGW